MKGEKMKELYLLRHAKSDWDDDSISDHERPLNKRGFRDAPAMGNLMKREGMVPDLVVSSTALRAKTTAELVTKEINRKPADIILMGSLYLASAAEILAQIRQTDESTERLLLVAHNPGITNLVNRLAGNPVNSIEMPTCGLAQFIFPGKWCDANYASFRLIHFYTPK